MTVYQFDEEHKYFGNSTSTGTEQERKSCVTEQQKKEETKDP